MSDLLGIKISELPEITDLNGTHTIGTDKNTKSGKVSLGFIKEAANYANSQGDYAKEVGDAVAGNVGSTDYPEFSASGIYAIGDVVRYNGRLYRFTAPHQSGAWNGADVILTSVNSEVKIAISEFDATLKTQSQSIVSYKEAINAQVEGQNQEIDVFKENVTDAVDAFKEAVTDQVNNYAPIVINGDVTNAPDEEDLTAENGLLKLKNRSALNGKGYVILRKEKTLVEEITLSNTIYEIRYDFDLGGKDIELKSSCVLFFNGGSIRNGKIIGVNTAIVNINNEIFNDIVIGGSWNVPYISDSLFGVQISNAENNTKVLKSLFALANKEIKNTIIIDKEYLYIPEYNTGIIVPSNTTIDGRGEIKIVPTELDKCSILRISDAENISISNLKLYGDLQEHLGTDGEWEYGIYIRGSKNIEIKNCELGYFWGDGIDIQKSRWYESDDDVEIDYQFHCHNIVIDNCNVHHSRRNNISVEAGFDIIIKNCDLGFAGAINGTLPMSGIDIEPIPENNQIVKNITIENCNIHDSVKQGILIPLENHYEGYVKIINTKSDYITSWAEKSNLDIIIDGSTINGSSNIIYTGGNVSVVKSTLNCTIKGKSVKSEYNNYGAVGMFLCEDGESFKDKAGSFENSGSSNFRVRQGDFGIVLFNREVGNIFFEDCHIQNNGDAVIKFRDSILRNCCFTNCEFSANSSSVAPFLENGCVFDGLSMEGCDITTSITSKMWLPMGRFANCRIDANSIFIPYNECYFENCEIITNNPISLSDIANQEDVKYIFVDTNIVTEGIALKKDSYNNDTYIKSIRSVDYDNVQLLNFTDDSLFSEHVPTKRSYYNYFKHSHDSANYHVLIKIPCPYIANIKFTIAPSFREVKVQFSQEIIMDVFNNNIVSAQVNVISKRNISLSDLNNLYRCLYKSDGEYIYLIVKNDHYAVNFDTVVSILTGEGGIVKPIIRMVPKNEVDITEYNNVNYSLQNTLVGGLDSLKEIDISLLNHAEAIDSVTYKHYWLIDSRWVDATGAQQ